VYSAHVTLTVRLNLSRLGLERTLSGTYSNPDVWQEVANIRANIFGLNVIDHFCLST